MNTDNTKRETFFCLICNTSFEKQKTKKKKEIPLKVVSKLLKWKQ